MKRPFVRFVAVVAAAQFISLRASSEHFDAAIVARNSAVRQSPRALEQFPQLTRVGAAPRTSVRAPVAHPARLALAPPRLAEEFPELQRVGVASEVGKASPGVPSRGLAANPRAAEDYPSLKRGDTGVAVDRRFEVAPVR